MFSLSVKKLLVIGLVAGGALALLNLSIIQRRGEAATLQAADQPRLETEAAKISSWESVYPYQVSSYLNAFNEGSSSNVLVDELEQDPRLVVLWAGYGFSKDYNKPRGHGYAVVDILNTLRTGAPTDDKSGPMPATCWSCKSPDVPRLMKEEGTEKFYSGKWARHGSEVVNPIGCADCHNEKTGKLQITRPALVEAFERQGKDITKASHQEMRSLVCAQCHVEYYFKKPSAYLTFPWDKGMDVGDMEEYYDQAEFYDWKHKISKAPMLKAQHPGYELFQQGIHAKRGVACADCHMPYKVEGGRKFSDHHVQSPRYNVANACQQCHRESESELISNMDSYKEKILDIKERAEDELVKAHFEAKAAWDLGATEEQMSAILQAIRHSQWRWDYAVASHGGFFHAPEESLRVLATALQKAGEARRDLAILIMRLQPDYQVVYPDISTKALAQKVIGMDIEKLKSEKHSFLNGLAKDWWTDNKNLDAKIKERTESAIQRK